jgi:hypothetical protein
MESQKDMTMLEMSTQDIKISSSITSHKLLLLNVGSSEYTRETKELIEKQLS